jgi:hypothetical protein
MEVLPVCVISKFKKNKTEMRFHREGRKWFGGECVTSVLCFPCCVGVHYEYYFGVNIL